MIYQLKFKVYRTLSFNLPYLRLINLSNYMVALDLYGYLFSLISYHEYNQHSNDRH